MIVHQVYFWMKPGMSPEDRRAFEDGMRSLFEIDVVRSGRWGKPAPTPSRSVTRNDFDYSLTLEFGTVTDHDVYQTHPEHQTFVDQFHPWFHTVRVYDSHHPSMKTEIRNSASERLDYDFHEAHTPRATNQLLVIGHGVTGNKDRPWAEALANAAANAGIPSLRFSFSGNGESEGRFEDSCITKEVDDLGAVLDAAVAEGYDEIIYAGHSMGGAVGVLRAAADARIRRLVSLAGMVHTKRFVTTEFGSETPGEGCMWEDESCPLSAKFVSDLEGIDSVLPKATEIHVPWLLVHGDQDDVVPIDESREIFAAARDPKEIVEIPGADHVFSGDAVAAMTAAVVRFF